MVTEERSAVLNVQLETAELSLGELGSLLLDLQVMLRATATTLGHTPPLESVRAARIRTGSLEFVVEVLGWLPGAAASVAPLALQAMGHAANAIALGVGAKAAYDIVGQMLQRRVQPSLPDIAIEHVDVEKMIAERTGRRERDTLIAKLAAEHAADQKVVESAVSAVEAAARATSRIHLSGGGVVTSPLAERKVEVRSRESELR